MSATPKLRGDCPRCAEGDHTRKKREDGLRHKATTKQPSIGTLERWTYDGIAETTDGCRTEPDGLCEHGHSSWLLVLGYI